MKKILFLTGILVGFFAGANAQNSFPTSNAIWNESESGLYNTYHGLFGDTIIDGNVYHRLYILSDTLLIAENLQEYLGGLRNEGEKVFFKPARWEEPDDILLYDFGASVGDTIWHNAIIWSPFWLEYVFPNEFGSYSVILSITIENNRKRYGVYCSAYWEPYYEWYEGIGSDRGVLRSVMTNYPVNEIGWGTLNCFKHNDTVKYLNNPKCNKCFCKKVNITESSYSDFISIFPNPTNDILNIKIRDNINIKSISIYSIEGKQIEKNKYFFKSGQLNISKLTTGTYIINFETDKGNFNQIIIKN